MPYVMGGPCTLCPGKPEHRDDDHPECAECGGTFEPVNECGACGSCVRLDAIEDAEEGE